MEKFKFLPGDLVLVNVPIPKLASQCPERIQRGGFWPAKITRKLQNSKRQVICYGTQEDVKVPLQSMIAYNQQSRKTHLPHNQLVKDSVLAQALDEIEADFVAKTTTAEQLHLSGEAQLITSVVKSAHFEINQQDNALMNLWNSYVEKTIGKISGICHLPRILIDFATEHKEAMTQKEIYKDFILHVLSLEEMRLISRFEVKNIVEDLAGLSLEGNNSASPVVVVSPSRIGDAASKDIIKRTSPDKDMEVPPDGNPTSFICSTTTPVTNDNSDKDDVVIDTLPERADIVLREDNPALASDASTILHVGMEHCTKAINEPILKCSEILEEGSSSEITDGNFNASANASSNVAENYPPSLCSHILENASSINVLDYLVDTSINMLTGPIQTSSLDNDQSRIIDNPSKTGVGDTVEPSTIASPCGDSLEQCWYGSKLDMPTMKETYKEVPRGSDETVVEILEDRSNNSNSTQMCLDAVQNTVENIAEIELEREETQRNVDNSNNEDDENKSDDEVEIIQVVGSATFMKQLFCDSKGKKISKSKRKRPMEKAKENKKHLVYYKNTGNDGTRSNGTSVGQSNTQQPWLKQSNPQQPWKGQSKPQQPWKGQSNTQQPWKGHCNCCGSMIDQSSEFNPDKNGNNCTVKIIINAQLSSESFSRVVEEMPNLKDMAGNVDRN